MGFGVLRTLIRPISRTLAARSSTSYTTPFLSSSPLPKPELRSLFGASLHLRSPWAPTSSLFHSLTDTRLPKRRPSDKHRRKRAAYKPSGPIVWIKSVPGGEPIRNQPNQGSVKRRNEKKRMQQRREFMLAEKKKRKAELQEANRKKMVKRVERKMAVVARERAWAERLAEMQRLEEEYKKTGTLVDRRTLLESTLHLANS